MKRFTLLAFLWLALGGLAAFAQGLAVPAPGADPRWDIIRQSTEYLSFTAQAAAAPDGGIPIRNLYQAYAAYKDAKTLTLADAERINHMLRQGGAEGAHVEDKGGGGLRHQNIGFYEDGRKVIDFPDWHTLPEKARYLDALLARVSSQELTREAAIDAAAEAHLIIGKQQLFSDGNHRTARVVSDWILMRQGLPPAAHFAMPKKSYELELRTTEKGALELFRQHMQGAVAAADKALGNAPVAAGRAPPAQAPPDSHAFGDADWRRDSPELERPVDAGLKRRLAPDPAMMIAFASGHTFFLDRAGALHAAPDDVALPKAGGFVEVDCAGDTLLALTADGRLCRIDQGQPVELLTGKPAYSFRVTSKGRVVAVLSTGLIVEYDGQKWRSLSGLDGARQATLDDRSLLFVLNEGGQAYQRTGGQWTMVDNGSGTRQIEAAGGHLHVLKLNGNVWRSGDLLRGVSWEQLDDGTGTREIALDASDGAAYVLKDDGSAFVTPANARAFRRLSPHDGPLVAIRVKNGHAVGLSQKGTLESLDGATDRRSDMRQQLFEQLGDR